MLGISDRDILQLVIISVVTLLVLAVKWRDLMLYCFDERQTRALGMNPTLLHILLMTLLVPHELVNTAVTNLIVIGERVSTTLLLIVKTFAAWTIGQPLLKPFSSGMTLANKPKAKKWSSTLKKSRARWITTSL